MSRPLRVEFPGAVYHLTARGNNKDDIFLNDNDRHCFLELFGQEVEQQRWICYAYCLMDNHYHLLVETPEGNLVNGMRRLNGRYTQTFNRRHGHIGHVFQGRYKSIVVEKDAYLFELSRYIVLNPVRAGMEKTPEAYAWSSYRSTMGLMTSPAWLASQALIKHFGNSPGYAKFVTDGINCTSPWDSVQGQIWLGSESYREQMQSHVPQQGVSNVPHSQLRPNRPSTDIVLRDISNYFGCTVEEVISHSHRKGYLIAVYLLRRIVNMPLAEVATLFNISIPRVSQIQRQILDGKLQNEAHDFLVSYKVKN